MRDEIIKMMEDKYIISGYMYSGAISPHAAANTLCCTIEEVTDTLFRLAEEGVVRHRGCQAVSFELAVEHRARLIDEHNLGDIWEKGAGAAFYPRSSEHGEISRVNNLLGKKDEGK